MSLTGFRTAVQNQLATALGIEIVAGKLPEEFRAARKDIGCVWPGSAHEVDGQVDLEQLVVYARIYKRFDQSQARNPEKPVDPTEIETLAELIQGSLDDIANAPAGGPWYFRVTSVEIDMDYQRVEAVIVGFDANVFQTTS
jgi:hypothetical protein